MHMKKLVFLFSFLCCAAFSSHAQWKTGVQAGVNLSDLSSSTNRTDGQARNSIVAGVTGQYTWKERYRLQTGLLFSVKGSTGLLNPMDRNVYPRMNIRLSYLELPCTFGYKIPLAPKIALIPEVGAFIACGIGGEVSEEGSVQPVGFLFNTWNPFKGKDRGTFEERTAFERFDGGLRFGLSAEVYCFILSVNYDLGLCSIHPTLNLPDNTYTRTASITLGYQF